MLIAARFSGPGSGKDLLSRAISLIASGLLPFSSFPIPVAPDSVRRMESGNSHGPSSHAVALGAEAAGLQLMVSELAA